MDNVIPLKQLNDEIIHDPSTTIVEKLEMTPELKKAFDDAGYNTEELE